MEQLFLNMQFIYDPFLDLLKRKKSIFCFFNLKKKSNTLLVQTKKKMLGSIQIHVFDFVVGFILGAISMFVYHLFAKQQQKNLTFQTPDKKIVETPAAVDQPNISPQPGLYFAFLVTFDKDFFFFFFSNTNT